MSTNNQTFLQDSPEFAARRGKFSNRNPEPSEDQQVSGRGAEVEVRDQASNTDRVEEVKAEQKPVIKPLTYEKSCNTEPRARTPPPARKVNHGTNTLKIRSIPKGTGTDVKMSDMLSREEVETRIQDAVFRTEEEIMSCPLLQKAMQKVEEEALKV